VASSRVRCGGASCSASRRRLGRRGGRHQGTRTDGGWVVSGQKVWTSDAAICQRGLATVRNRPEGVQTQGITAMIIDLADPAVEVRPLTEITGETLFNEVFLNDVFVSDDDVVGEVNAAWRGDGPFVPNERSPIGRFTRRPRRRRTRTRR